LYKLSQDEINSLGFPDGVLLEVIPGDSSLDSLVQMQKVVYMLQQYARRFSFEIWKDDGFSFRFFSSIESLDNMIKSQLRSVYPQAFVRMSKASTPKISKGGFVSACSIVLYGSELNLKSSEDFRYDPLRHILEAMNKRNSRVLVQILFERIRKIPKDKRIILAQKYGDTLFFRGIRIPVLKCLVRIVAFSDEGYQARQSCENVARAFSVFDSDRCQLIPNIVSYPIFWNSYRFLKSIARREFPLLSDSFTISVAELASMVHLPVGAESCGVEYSKPSLSSLPW
jgi:ribosomal protein L31E